MKGRQLAINLALSVGSLALVCLLAEVALRVVLLRNLNPFEPAAGIGFRLKASFDGAYPRVPVKTDERRRRIPSDLERSGERLLFVGDSVAFGFGVLAEESFPYRVGELLGRRQDVALAAVPGYNLEQVLAAIETAVAGGAPEVIIYGLVVNDIGSADSPVTYEEIDPHANRMREGGLLSRSLLAAFIQRRWARVATRLREPEPQAAPAPEDDFERGLSAEAVAAFDRQWARLETVEERHGVPVYVLVCPYRQQVEGGDPGQPMDGYQRFVRERCRSGRLTCLDPLPMMRAHGDEELFNGTSSFHYTARGHRLIAQWLVGEIFPGS